MGFLFKLFSYVSGYIAILLLALSIASGLYLLSELTEEFPSFTGKVLRYAYGVIMIVFVILWWDGLPMFECCIEVVALICYLSMLMSFPFVQFMSFPTISSMIAFLVTNLTWVQYFLAHDYDALSIIGFFVVIVWTIPIGLFVSLSANDNVLPGLFGQPTDGGNGLDNSSSNSSSGKKKSIFRSIADGLLNQFDVLGDSNVFKLVSNKRR
jgi:hypothetical protein